MSNPKQNQLGAAEISIRPEDVHPQRGPQRGNEFPRHGRALLSTLLALSLLAPSIASAQTLTVPPAATPATPAAAAPRDWRWVKGAVFVPTNAVNEAQEWDQYDPATNDRELHYASIYGINCVRVYLHYYVYLKKKDKMLAEIEDFLQRADKYGIKTEFVFFDDCWNVPDKAILQADYGYPAPIPGVHNSRWLQSPGLEVKADYVANRDKLKAYVQDIVNAHKDDKRIAFWETYNEPNHSPETARLLADSEEWVHETGTSLPLTATGGGFAGDSYSDFKSWHEYDGYKPKGGADDLCTECMHRATLGAGQDVPSIVSHWEGTTGFEVWEFGIGRDNCRFAWGENRKTPRKTEAVIPFHGVVYPDGHPWAVEDVKALMGADKFAKTPFFAVQYYRDTNFTDLAKTSISPMLDFSLYFDMAKLGNDSPDATVGVPARSFSERWTGTIIAPKSGQYKIYVESDGGVSLIVDGKMLAKKKFDREVIRKVDLTVGTPHMLVIEYSRNEPVMGWEYPYSSSPPYGPNLRLQWSGPGMEKQLLLPGAPAPILAVEAPQ